MKARKRTVLAIAIEFLIIFALSKMGISTPKCLDVLTALLVFAGTYIITKESFLSAIKSEIVANNFKIDDMGWFYKLACTAYFINKKNYFGLFTYPSDPKRLCVTSPTDAFRGFAWISAGVVVQIGRILFCQ